MLSQPMAYYPFAIFLLNIGIVTVHILVFILATASLS
jgi:hypothetical protein